MRHATALALLAAWILIEPPSVWVHDSAQLFANAPLSSWVRPDGDEARSFESEMECENFRAKELAALASLHHDYPQLDSLFEYQQKAHMICIRFED